MGTDHRASIHLSQSKAIDGKVKPSHRSRADRRISSAVDRPSHTHPPSSHWTPSDFLFLQHFGTLSLIDLGRFVVHPLIPPPRAPPSVFSLAVGHLYSCCFPYLVNHPANRNVIFSISLPHRHSVILPMLMSSCSRSSFCFHVDRPVQSILSMPHLSGIPVSLVRFLLPFSIPVAYRTSICNSPHLFCTDRKSVV